MKRIIAIVAVVLAVSFVGCGERSDDQLTNITVTVNEADCKCECHKRCGKK